MTIEDGIGYYLLLSGIHDKYIKVEAFKCQTLDKLKEDPSSNLI